jgi:hypothetical protein
LQHACNAEHKLVHPSAENRLLPIAVSEAIKAAWHTLRAVTTAAATCHTLQWLTQSL